MMHPMEFANELAGVKQNTVNVTQLNELRNLLNLVKNSGLRVVPIQRINLDAPTTPIHMAITTGTTTTGSSTTGSSTTGAVTTTTTGSTTTGGVMVANVTCNCVAFRCNVQ